MFPGYANDEYIHWSSEDFRTLVLKLSAIEFGLKNSEVT